MFYLSVIFEIVNVLLEQYAYRVMLYSMFHMWKLLICIILAEFKFIFYSQTLIVNAVLRSFRGFMCNIFNHQVVWCKCHKQ